MRNAALIAPSIWADIDARWPCLDRATQLALAAVDDALRGQALSPDTALYLGTSLGGVVAWEPWHRALTVREALPVAPPRVGHDDTAPAVARALGLRGEVVTVSTACTSSAAALMQAADALRLGEVDAALVVGVDVLCRFVHAGFDRLCALTPDTAPPAPFAADRAGMWLGEAAAAVLLTRDGPAVARYLGGGASGDGVHMTAPDRTGAGLARAITRALARGERCANADVAWVSAHATSTRFNDAMEAAALRAVFGDAAPPVHGLKPVTGTLSRRLGARRGRALRRGAPSSRTSADAHAAGARTLARVAHRRPRADGDARGPRALAQRRDGGAQHRARDRCPVSDFAITAWAALSAAGEGAPHTPHWTEVDGVKTSRITASIRALWPAAPDRTGRMDRASAHALLVAQRALTRSGIEADRASSLAVVVGTALGCAEVNERYHRGLVERGSEGASPILFAQTIPSAPAGEIAIALGVRGHATTVMAGRASAVAALIEARRAIALGRADGSPRHRGRHPRPRPRAAAPFERAQPAAAEAVVALVLEPVDAVRARGRAPLATLEHASVRVHDGGDDAHPDWLGASGAVELSAWLDDPSRSARFEHEVRCASGRLGALRLRR